MYNDCVNELNKSEVNLVIGIRGIIIIFSIQLRISVIATILLYFSLRYNKSFSLTCILRMKSE